MAIAVGSKHHEILEAAARLFEQKGYHATSVQDIADEVGLQKASLYHYIQSKDDLLTEIALEAITSQNARLEAIAGAAEPASRRLARAITEHVRAMAKNRATFTIYLREQHAISEREQARVLEASDRYAHLLEGIVADGIASGEFRGVDPKAATMAILGACNYLYRWYSPAGRLGPDAVAQEFTALFLRGLVAGG